MAEQIDSLHPEVEEDPKEPFIGDVLPSNTAEEDEEPLTWEEIDAAADRALAQGDEIAREAREQ